MNIHTIQFHNEQEEDFSNLMSILTEEFSEDINHNIPELKEMLVEEAQDLKIIKDKTSKMKNVLKNRKKDLIKSELFNHIIQEINIQFKTKKLTKAYVLENVYDLVHNYTAIPPEKLQSYYKALTQNR